MTRLIVHVEGQTEETLVRELIAPHFYEHGFLDVSARLIGTARQRTRRGGAKSWASVRAEIAGHLRGDQGVLSTTIVDYYGLPQYGHAAWPGRSTASGCPFPLKGKTVEDALSADLYRSTDENVGRRFIPYVMMHEFEALLFSDCVRFAAGIDRPTLASRLQAIRDSFSSPEEIDDSPHTAPSKRILELNPGYEKPLMGAVAALEIGLGAMRSECPHFDYWLTKLESLVG